jgi:hypothetical protein
MEYVNLESGVKINLDSLTKAEVAFYLRALKKFQQNANWLDFDDFVLGMQSPLYSGKRSHHEVLRCPLFLALKDMSLQLGIRQGMIAKSKNKKEQEAVA